MTERDFRFAPARIAVSRGMVTFTLTNRGAFAHNFKIAGRKATGLLQPGRSRTVSFRLQKGTYSFVCTVPGHAAQGMRGTIVVR
jgi:plastocyanin